MKKVMLLLGFLAALLTGLHAQETTVNYGPGEESPFRFGIQASPTFSWMRTNDKFIEGTGSNLGVKLGVMLEKYFVQQDGQNRYGFVTGLGFGFNQGGTVIVNYDSITLWANSELSDPNYRTLTTKGSRLHYRLTYVEVPLGLKFRGGSNEDSKFKYWVEAPVFTLGFLTKALGDIRNAGEQNTDDEVIRDDVHALSVAWGIGAGAEYEVATGTAILAGIQYQHQFTDLTEDGGTVRTANGSIKEDDSKGRLGVLVLRLGVLF